MFREPLFVSVPTNREIELQKDTIDELEILINPLLKQISIWDKKEGEKLEVFNKLENILASVNYKVDMFENWLKNDAKRADFYKSSLAQLYLLRGQIIKKTKRTGDWEENFNAAVVDYTASIELNPDNANAYVLRGKTYKQMRNYDNQSISDFEKSLLLDPLNADTYCQLGSLLEKRDPQKAADYFEKAIDITPYDYDIYCQWISCIPNKGVHFVFYLKRLIGLNPNDVSAYIKCSVIYGENKNFSEAIDYLIKAIHIAHIANAETTSLNNGLRHLYSFYAEKICQEQPADYKKALNCIDQALQILIEENHDYSDVLLKQFLTAVQISKIMNDENKIIHYYEQFHKVQSKFSKKCLKMSYDLCDLHQLAMQVYINTKMYGKARDVMMNLIHLRKDKNELAIVSQGNIFDRSILLFLMGEYDYALSSIEEYLYKTAKAYDTTKNLLLGYKNPRELPPCTPSKATLEERYKTYSHELCEVYRLRIGINKELGIFDDEAIDQIYEINPAYLSLKELCAKNILMNHDEIYEGLDDEFFKQSSARSINSLKDVLIRNDVSKERCLRNTNLNGLTLFSKINDYLEKQKYQEKNIDSSNFLYKKFDNN